MPPTTPNNFYPALSDIMKADDLPDFLGFIKEGIQSIFEKIYIKDFQANISPRGESGFYGLSLVSKTRLEFKIPGTELSFIPNPDYDDSNISSFPVIVFSLADDNNETLAHEVFHSLGFAHTFDKISKNSKYVFKSKETENIMNYTADARPTYHWQWLIARKNVYRIK